MSAGFHRPPSPHLPPVPTQAVQHHVYNRKLPSTTDLGVPAYSLADGAVRQQHAVPTQRLPAASPPRAMRAPLDMPDDDALILQAASDADVPSVMASVAGMSLAGSDEALSAMTAAAAQAQKSGVRNSAHKRVSRGTADSALRPHTSSPHPPLPHQAGGYAARQSESSSSSSLSSHSQGHRAARGATDASAPWAGPAGDSTEPRAPTPAMYWSRRRAWGAAPPTMRSQTMTVVGSKLYVFGGWNNNVCYNDVYVLDTETLFWTRVATAGDDVPPCRAHTATAVGHRLFVFGGGDGTQYFSDLYVLDTRTCVWTRAKVADSTPPPSPRRTHTCFHYNGHVYLFGGGDGHRALNDLWRVCAEPDAASGEYRWEEVETAGGRPFPRGYHTSTLVGNQVVVFGGSDGAECFGDTSLLNLDTLEWSHVAIDPPLTRLAHSATLVGMYLFVICGHDGSDYSNQVLMLKLDTLKWETREIYGSPPVARGYHACALHDGRLFLHGGYNGQEVFGDLYTLELSSYSYLPQVPEFVIGCHR
ncbi:hypothetical protein LPJ61_001272 [Coemansia biformis]|uniref:Galactose oxidase n=1 Tax=Coemansia biformis TaxID=1286918 RepID=A0A9W7YF73_9FUNG|nr:hypothetical protein LPJ61_001272 [Coemansia biformis]